MLTIKLTKEEKAIRLFLIEHATNASERSPYVFYQDLSVKCGLGLDMMNVAHRDDINALLSKISMFEQERKRPILSSLVVSKTYEPADAFYKMCETIGMGEWRKLKENRVDFEMSRECLSYWKKKNK